MKSLNRREFVKGSLGMLSALTVLPKSEAMLQMRKLSLV